MLIQLQTKSQKAQESLLKSGTCCQLLLLACCTERWLNRTSTIAIQFGPASQHKRENLEKILKIQKRFCRIITFSTFQAHSQPLFKQLALMTVYDIFKYQLAMFMYKCVNNLLPQHSSFNFVVNDTLHDYSTRSSTNLHIVYCRTKCRWTTVQIQGPKLWNSLPKSLKEIPSPIRFKIKLKKFIWSLFD